MTELPDFLQKANVTLEEARETAFALLNLCERRGLDRESLRKVRLAFEESGIIEPEAQA